MLIIPPPKLQDYPEHVPEVGSSSSFSPRSPTLKYFAGAQGFAPNHLVEGPPLPYQLLPIYPHLYGVGHQLCPPIFTHYVCREISHYLFLIHDNFQHVHRVDPERLAERAPQSQFYRMRPQIASRLIKRIEKLYRTLYALSHRGSLGADAQTQKNLSVMFEQLGLRQVDAPDGIHDLRLFAGYYPSQSGIAELVSDAQLWVEFTELLCGLAAHMIGDSDEPQFSPGAFKRRRLVVSAHNYYLRELGFPQKYYIKPA